MMAVDNLEKDLEWEFFLTLEKVVEVVMEVVEVEFAPVLLQEFVMELEWDGVMLLRGSIGRANEGSLSSSLSLSVLK